MDVNYYHADSEAEGTCSLMNRKGMVDGVLTEDTDVIAYGAPVMYHNFSYRLGTVQKLRTSRILDMLNISFSMQNHECFISDLVRIFIFCIYRSLANNQFINLHNRY
mgnify:CR=1 FL=1